MSKRVFAAALSVIVALCAGCGGGGSAGTSAATAVSGKVADGYLVKAKVFLDRNGNYRLDGGEPVTVTDDEGSFTLHVSPSDVGRCPIVAVAVKGVTTDLDNPGQVVTNSYLMSFPAAAVTEGGACFVSPISTIMREKMAARAGMTLTEAMNEIRTQMNLPPGMNLMADYVRLGSAGSTDSNKSFYLAMHSTAQGMASLMAGRGSLVMGLGSAPTVDVNRYRTMIGLMNLQLPQMTAAMTARNPGTTMSDLAARIEASVTAIPPMMAGMPFRNMTSFFPPMMGMRFWNMTGNFIWGSTGGGFWNMTGQFGGGMMGGRNGWQMSWN